jgi:hypothetical protein
MPQRLLSMSFQIQHFESSCNSTHIINADIKPSLHTQIINRERDLLTVLIVRTNTTHQHKHWPPPTCTVHFMVLLFVTDDGWYTRPEHILEENTFHVFKCCVCSDNQNNLFYAQREDDTKKKRRRKKLVFESWTLGDIRKFPFICKHYFVICGSNLSLWINIGSSSFLFQRQGP